MARNALDDFSEFIDKIPSKFSDEKYSINVVDGLGEQLEKVIKEESSKELDELF